MCQIIDTFHKMPYNFKKDDLRIKKTYNALIDAMHKIASRRNFNQITVNDLCEEAIISRATFYVHFKDKYDLLKFWLSDIKHRIINTVYEYEKIETVVNQFIHDNQKVVTNILKDANSETLEIVKDFISSIIDFLIKRKIKNVNDPTQIVLSNFCTGGLISLLLLQVKKSYPTDFNMMNFYLYELLTYIMEWDEQKNVKRMDI